MIVRHPLGDLAFAILIALPAVAFVQPQPLKPAIETDQPKHTDGSLFTRLASADHRISLLG
jgi:hypothetical protein